MSAVSKSKTQGQKTENAEPRDSRSITATPSNGESDAETPTHHIREETALQDTKSRKQYSDPRTAKYVSAYADWTAGMSDADRAKLAALGVDKPLVDDHHATGIGLDEDMADSAAASYTPDIAAMVDGEAEIGKEHHCHGSHEVTTVERIWDVMRRLVGELLDTPNRSLTAECLAAVSGMSYTGDSITEIANRHRVSRAAVSKRCVELTKKLKLLPSRTMRSLTARKAYRHAQRELRHHDET